MSLIFAVQCLTAVREIKALPTEKMSAVESHSSLAVDAATQTSVQMNSEVPDRIDNRTSISHQANNGSVRSAKDKH